jgi:peroxiredoxin
MVVAAICSTFAYAQEGKMARDSMKEGSKMFVSAEDAAKKALNVGAKMPSFTLNDSLGKSVNSADLLKQGHLVVVFYRGAWCPFCNAYLHKLQKNLSQIKDNGGNLVAISVENADRSMAVAKKNELNFTVLSDPNLNVARSFGIVYQLSDETNEKYKGYGIDLVKYNKTEKPELPISATYVVSKKGEIAYAFVEPDYQKRAEPEAILQALAKLKK